MDDTFRNAQWTGFKLGFRVWKVDILGKNWVTEYNRQKMRDGMALDWGSQGWSFPALGTSILGRGRFSPRHSNERLLGAHYILGRKGALNCRQADVGNSLAVFIPSWAGGSTPFCCKTGMAWETLQMGLNARSPGLSVTWLSRAANAKLSLNRAQFACVGTRQ